MKNTKRIYTIVVMLILTTIAFSANSQGKYIQAEPSHFLFDAFKDGVLKKKTGTRVNYKLNYNTVTEEVVYEDAGRKMTFANLDAIDTVFIEGRKFIPYKKVFLEVIKEGAVSLFIQHRCDLLSKGTETGYGKSQTTRALNISEVTASATIYEFELPEEFYVAARNVYWVKKGDDMVNITNKRKLLRLFPENKNKINKYIKENNLKAKDIIDLVKIVEYCNQLY